MGIELKEIKLNVLTFSKKNNEVNTIKSILKDIECNRNEIFNYKSKMHNEILQHMEFGCPNNLRLPFYKDMCQRSCTGCWNQKPMQFKEWNGEHLNTDGTIDEDYDDEEDDDDDDD